VEGQGFLAVKLKPSLRRLSVAFMTYHRILLNMRNVGTTQPPEAHELTLYEVHSAKSVVSF